MKFILILVVLITSVSASEIIQGSAKANSALVPKWMHQWMGMELTPEPNVQIRQWSENMLLEYYWKTYSTNQSESVYDKQGYFTDAEKDVVNDLLKKHSEISKLPIRLIIFGKGQITPERMGPTWLWKKFFKGTPSVVIYYFLGDPSSTLAYIHGGAQSREVDDFRTKELMNKAAQFALDQSPNAKEQCYAFIEQVSRRMYWIEDDLGLVQIDHNATADFDEEKVKADEESALDQWLDKLGVSNVLGKHRGLVSLIVMSLVGLLIILLGIFIYRRVCSYEFPLYGGPRRLGGRHGAGLGEIVSFKDARVSLVDQKKKLKDEEL